MKYWITKIMLLCKTFHLDLFINIFPREIIRMNSITNCNLCCVVVKITHYKINHTSFTQRTKDLSIKNQVVFMKNAKKYHLKKKL